jgi:chromosome segregation ATPase
MSDSQNEGGNPLVRNILMVVAAVFVIGSIIFMVQAQNQISAMDKKLNQAQLDLAKKMDDANTISGQTRAKVDVLADKVGITHKDLSKKAAALQAEEQATQSRLKADEESTKQQFGQVSGEVANVKGEVSKIGADVSDTKSDLAATKGRLENAIGDLNKHSELIATTHDQLEALKHRGDRDYLEFTLTKGKDPTRLATVSLQLKKVDPKKNEFTLYVLADDKRIEKKDRTINEPLQFYTGRDRNLYEVVVNTMDKNTITGYMVTPKNVAANTTPDPRTQQ